MNLAGLAVAAPHTTLATRSGASLAVRDWPLQPGVTPRAMVVLVHGLGEHSGRYDHVARKFNDWGFPVRAYDQCGHGGSDGAPGSLSTDTRLLDDLADVLDDTRARIPPDLPVVLLGHSMGGLVAARFVSLALRPVDALVLSSPALDPGLSRLQKLLVAVLPRLVPNLRVGNGVKPDFISHDPAVVSAYRRDPLVHDRISTRLAAFIASAGPATVQMAAQWQVPTLLLFSGDDRLLNADGSRRFAAAAPPAVVEAVCFDTLYHEIFNELDATAVFATLEDWLGRRF